MVEQVFDSEILIALIIRSNFNKKGIEFFTPENMPLQLGFMHRDKGHKIKPHKHEPKFLGVQQVQEVLFLKTGKVLVQFFKETGDFISERIIEMGDVILLVSGAHSFEMLENSQIFEVKQGPYLGLSDKTMIEACDPIFFEGGNE